MKLSVTKDSANLKLYKTKDSANLKLYETQDSENLKLYLLIFLPVITAQVSYFRKILQGEATSEYCPFNLEDVLQFLYGIAV